MAFRVYGMTEAKARQLATKNTPPPLPGEVLQEFEARVDKRFKKYMESKKSVPLSQVFDAPQFARQFIALAIRAGEHRDLHIRHPVTSWYRKKGRQVKKTAWVEYQP